MLFLPFIGYFLKGRPINSKKAIVSSFFFDESTIVTAKPKASLMS
jgi:hypothetical protein